MRKLATVRKIAEIKQIPEADLIVAYRVDGWLVVDKKGQYQVGDMVVYCEVDSWIPHELAPFLSKGKEPRVFEGVPGERLRTVRLKGQLSQGLFLPGTQCPTGLMVKQHNSVMQHIFQEGDDVSDWLGIKKWEPIISAQLACDARGLFPSVVPKTEAERIQNLASTWDELRKHEFEVTEKMHGSSCSFYLDLEKDFHVCSRNLDLKLSETNAYWKAALKYNVQQNMLKHGLAGLALQGEIVGEGLNGNQYKLGLEFFLFSIYDVQQGKYLDAYAREEICDILGLQHVPVVQLDMSELSVEQALVAAEGKSKVNGSEREGLVLKSQEDTSVIVKIISNRWLLKNE